MNTPMHCGMSFVLGTVQRSKDNKAVQGLQVRLSHYQVRDNVPMFGLHGDVSRPLPGAQILVAYQGGDPTKSIGFATNDPRYYLPDLPDGTVGKAHHLGASMLIFDDRVEVNGGGKLVKVMNASKVRIEGDLEVTGEVKAMCDGAFVTLSQHQGHTGGGQKPTPNT